MQEEMGGSQQDELAQETGRGRGGGAEARSDALIASGLLGGFRS